MQVYTYSEARQKLTMLLDQAEDTGKARCSFAGMTAEPSP